MVRQYRHGAGQLTLETPGGLIDPGETPAEAAARELLEETGYAADEIVSLGAVNPNPALFSNRLHGFLARGAQRVRECATRAPRRPTSSSCRSRRCARRCAQGA